MVVSFPHMGNIYIPLKAAFDDLGVDYVVPPFCSKRTLDLGTRIAPDSICLPLKINLGNYIESAEKGADTFILTGSRGPCRFGYYGVSEKEILEDNGYPVDMVILDPASGFKVLYKRMKKAMGDRNIFKTMRALGQALSVCGQVDALEREVFRVRAREAEKGDADAAYVRFRKDVLDLKGTGAITTLIADTMDKLKKIKTVPDANPLKIGIIGEIYTIIEPYTNLNIEQKLGAMGVEADRSMTASDWIKDKIFHRSLGNYADTGLYESAKPYLDRCIGGHTQECIGHALRYARAGYDGAIEVLPFGCMPEIVAETIIPQVSKDADFPILTLVVDEMTGETGFATRIEAFLDLVRYRKKRVSA
jgi:predicted nucleotide-binding protein (sugar kinase/HSP70/actin superfamily)